MKFLILTINQTLESIVELTKKIEHYGATYQVINPFNYDHDQILKESYEVILNRISGISYDDSDLELLKRYQIKWPRTLIVNDPNITAILRDKALQAELFQKIALESIPTLDLQTCSQMEIETFTKSNRALKYLIKPIRSNQAKGIIKTIAPLKDYQKLRETKDTRYILQPLLLKRAEWRILAINNVIIGVLKKTHNDPEELLNCEKASLEYISDDKTPDRLSDFLNAKFWESPCSILAFDILEDIEGKYRLIEVNNVPGFKYFEKTTGISPAKILVKCIFNHLRF